MTAPRTPEEFDWYSDPYDYPELPLPQRLIAVCHPDEDGSEFIRGIGEGDGVYDTVLGLIADHDYRTDLAIAHTMGLVGDWGTDDVREAVTNALYEYRDFRAQRIALLALQADLLDGYRDGTVSRESVRRVHEVLTTVDPYRHDVSEVAS